MPFWREGGSVLPPPPPPTRKPPLPPNQPKTGINVTPKTPPPMHVQPPPMHVQPPPLPEPLPATPMAVPPPPPPTAVTTRRQVMPPAPPPYSQNVQVPAATLQYEPSVKVPAPRYATPRVLPPVPRAGAGQEGSEGEEGRRGSRRAMTPWRISTQAALNRLGYSSVAEYQRRLLELGFEPAYVQEVIRRLTNYSMQPMATPSGAIEPADAARYMLLELQRAAAYNPDVAEALRNSPTALTLAAFYNDNSLAVGWPDFYDEASGELPAIMINGYPFDYTMLLAFEPELRALFGIPARSTEDVMASEEGVGGGYGGGGYAGGGYGGRAAAEDIAQPTEDVQQPDAEEPPPHVPRNYEIATWLARLIKVKAGRVFQFPEPARVVLRNMGLADELWKILLDLGFRPVDIGPDGFPTDVIVPDQYNYDPAKLTQYLNGLSRLQRFVLRYLLAVNFGIGEIPEPPKKLKPPKPPKGG